MFEPTQKRCCKPRVNFVEWKYLPLTYSLKSLLCGLKSTIISSSLVTCFPSPGTSPLEPMVPSHQSGFKFQTVALSLLCATSLVQLSFVQSVECFPSIVPRCIFRPLFTIPVAPMFTGVTKHFMFAPRREEVWGSRGLTPCIHILHTREVSGGPCAPGTSSVD